MLDNLQNATPETKSLALDALDIKVYARGIDDVEIKGVIPLELALPTTGQTSAHLVSNIHKKARVDNKVINIFLVFFLFQSVQTMVFA